MVRSSYVNGRYVYHNHAQLHIEDRATQFSDGVYEVIAIISGVLIDYELHQQRLLRSLKELEIELPTTPRVLRLILQEVVRRNRIKSGLCYLQISRGIAPRNHAFPTAVRPSLIVTAKHSQPAGGKATIDGVTVVTVPDIRWRRRDIKAISLLPNVLAKEKAAKSQAFEAWLVEGEQEQTVVEGSSSNAWMINTHGELITHPAGHKILSGITRNRLISLAVDNGIKVIEEPFSIAQAKGASETFLTSTSSFVVPVTSVDGSKIGDGTPGPVTRSLVKMYGDFVVDYCRTALGG